MATAAVAQPRFNLLLLSGFAALASFVPAFRASRVQPVHVLRDE